MEPPVVIVVATFVGVLTTIVLYKSVMPRVLLDEDKATRTGGSLLLGGAYFLTAYALAPHPRCKCPTLQDLWGVWEMVLTLTSIAWILLGYFIYMVYIRR